MNAQQLSLALPTSRVALSVSLALPTSRVALSVSYVFNMYIYIFMYIDLCNPSSWSCCPFHTSPELPCYFFWHSGHNAGSLWGKQKYAHIVRTGFVKLYKVQASNHQHPSSVFLQAVPALSPSGLAMHELRVGKVKKGRGLPHEVFLPLPVQAAAEFHPAGCQRFHHWPAWSIYNIYNIYIYI